MPHRGDVWDVDLEPVLGHEQGRVRPALIISDDILNEGPAGLVIVLPITSKLKPWLPSMVELRPPAGGLTAVSYVLCDQIRTISTLRLRRRRGSVPERHLTAAVDIVASLMQA